MVLVRSLQLMSLDVIAEHFEKFYLAFTSSKDPILKRNLAFLQRRFSDHLAGVLFRNKLNTDLYFDFLINEHLSFIDFYWFIRSKHLRSIDDIFCHSPNLTRVKFYEHGDEIMESVTKFCPKIVEIRADCSHLTDKGMKYLCEVKNGKLPCPELKRIFLCNTFVTDRSVEILVRHFPLLEYVEYDDLPLVLYSIHENNLTQFQKEQSYNLLELNLTRCKEVSYFTDVLKTCLTVCPKLESVNCRISEEEQLHAFNSTQLKKLDLEFSEVKLKFNIDQLLKGSGRNLTFLRIYNCMTSASVLAEHCPVLEYLALLRVNFTDDSDPQSIFPCLTKCSLYGTKPPVLKAFHLLSVAAPTLESLSFSSCIFSLELKEEILIRSRLSTIKDISFLCLHIEITFLRDILLNLRSLRQMYLFNCTYDVPRPREILNVLAENLPNKPKIVYDEAVFDTVNEPV